MEGVLIQNILLVSIIFPHGDSLFLYRHYQIASGKWILQCQNLLYLLLEYLVFVSYFCFLDLIYLFVEQN